MKPLPVIALVLAAAASSSVLTVLLLRSSHEPKTAPVVQEAKPDPHAADNARLRDELAKAQVRVQELEAAAKASEEAAATVQAAAAPPPAAPEPAPKEDAKKKPSLDEIRGMLTKNPGVSAQMQAITELIYADLLNSMNLDPETKAALRQMLLDSQMEHVALAQYAMMKGDLPWNQVTQWDNDERALLDQQIKALLPEKDYKTWQDYAASIDERALEASLRNQIRAFASGLTDENFESVMNVAVEEFLAEQQALAQSNTNYTAAENLNYQIRAMEAMRERLQASLPADQFAEINNWLNMGINMFNQQLASMANESSH